MSFAIILILILTSWMIAVSSTLQSQEIIKTDFFLQTYESLTILQLPIADTGGLYFKETYVHVSINGSDSFHHDQRNKINKLEFLNKYPIIKNKIKEKYPLLYSFLSVSNGPLDLNNSRLFSKYRLLKTIILFVIIRTIIDHTTTNRADEVLFSYALKWIRNHPGIVIGLSLILLMLLSKLSDKTTVEDENPDIIEENKPPHANAGGPYSEQVGIPIMFSAENSYDEDGTIITFDWDFGDGTKGTGETISHRYNYTGTFITSLTVTDDKGKKSTDTTVITISSTNSNLTDINNNNSLFWIVSGSLSVLLLVGLLGVKFRRQLFE